MAYQLALWSFIQVSWVQIPVGAPEFRTTFSSMWLFNSRSIGYVNSVRKCYWRRQNNKKKTNEQDLKSRLTNVSTQRKRSSLARYTFIATKDEMLQGVICTFFSAQQC